jgi:hypothetical protein
MSFLSYLGYGYLDSWHGVATLALLPLYLAGLVLTHGRLSLDADKSWRALKPKKTLFAHGSAGRFGRWFLLLYGGGLLLAGGTICFLGMTRVFVPEDLAYIGLTRVEICGISPRLLPVIAHDRAGFGGQIFTVGVTIVGILLHAPVTRNLRQVIFWSGCAGFGAAIGFHFVIGYLDLWHLAPAFVGAALFLTGIIYLRSKSSDELR